MSNNKNDEAIEAHKKLKGKIRLELKDELDTTDKLSTYYTPGVAAVSSEVARNPESARELTFINNTVAVVSDGSAVLGLGNIGPLASLPVMEGKAMLFKHFADIDAWPIVLDVHTVEEIVATVKAIAPGFGGINLEDIAAPQCFEIEAQLKKELNIPVMHDDQHGTAVVVLAGLINALKIVKKDLSNCRITIVGAGAAGIAIAKLLLKYDSPNILLVDSKGIIAKSRTDLNEFKQAITEYTNTNNESGSLEDAVKGSDIFIGVSKAGLLSQEMVKSMSNDAIIFAMANPAPEIMPDEAREAGAKVIATGRSDFPNQVNNALAFPGIFRGALDNQINAITDQHKLAAAKVIASFVENPTPEEIIPGIHAEGLVQKIADVIT